MRKLPASPLVAFAAAAAAAAAAALAGAGCVEMDKEPIEPPPKAAYMYVVGAGDLLSVEVWREVDLTRHDIVVAPDGTLSFPLVGSVDVKGKTLAQVAALVTERLRRYLTEPFVTVTLRESRSAQVHVLGELAREGPQPYREHLTLVQVLAAAAIRWPTAKTERVGVVRGALDDPKLIEVDLDLVLVGLEKDVWLMPGDIVVVPPKYISRFDRYVTQLLSPIRSLTGATREAAGTTAGGGF